MSMVAKHQSGARGFMLPTPIRRLMWKEARELLPIWLSVALASALTLALTFWSTNADHASLSPLYLAAYTLTAFFALVTGICLFASENENRTVQLLRNLPLKPTVIVWQKLTVGVVGVLVFAAVAASVASVLGSWSTSRSSNLNESHYFSVTNCIAFPLFYLAISSLAATLTRSFFYGFLWAGAALLAVMIFVEPTWFGYVHDSYPDSWLKGPLLSLAAVAAGALIVGRSRAWIEERVPHSPRASVVRTSLKAKPSTAQRQLSRLSVLLWQSFAQSKRVLCVYAILVVAAAILCWWRISFDAMAFGEAQLLGSLSALCCAVFLLIPFSASVFLADQRNANFRFFQQNVETPRLFWVARLLPWWCVIGVVVLLWHVFLIVVQLQLQHLFSGNRYHDVYWQQQAIRSLSALDQFARQTILVPATVMLGVLGIGQLFSMIVRSSILATIFAVLVNLCFVCFACYVVFVDENVWLFLMLPVVAVYLATWFGARDWLAGKTGWRYYARPLAIAAAAAVFAICGFAYHRAYELDNVVFDVDNLGAYWPTHAVPMNGAHGRPHMSYGTPAERKRAAKLYREAISMSVEPTNHDDPAIVRRPVKARQQAYLDRNAKSIQKIVEAAKCEGCDPFLSERRDEATRERSLLTQLGRFHCDHLIRDGSLEEAFEAILGFDRLQCRVIPDLHMRNATGGTAGYELLIRWAERPDQRLELIEQGIEFLEANYDVLDAAGQRLTPAVMNERWKTETFELGGELALSSLQYALRDLRSGQAGQYEDVQKTFRLFPWEWIRFQKLAQRAEANAFGAQLAMIGLLQDNTRQFDWQQLLEAIARIQFKSARNWPISPGDGRLAGLELESVGPHYFSNYFLEYLDARRYALLRLGLAAYRVENGEYPRRLAMLDKYYRGKLPTTAKSNQSVDWFPDGLMMEFTEVVGWNEEVATENVSLKETGATLIFSDSYLETFDPDQNRYVPARDDLELDRSLKSFSRSYVVPFRNHMYSGSIQSVDARLPEFSSKPGDAE